MSRPNRKADLNVYEGHLATVRQLLADLGDLVDDHALRTQTARHVHLCTGDLEEVESRLDAIQEFLGSTK